MENYHLAQINIAYAHHSLESEEMSGFVGRIDEINALADQAPGFIWRLKSDDGGDTYTAVQAFDDPSMLINMSVWQDIDSLKNYVYKSIHIELLRNKSQWFTKMKDAHQAMWWIPAGHIPTIQEGKDKLDYIREHGPSLEAFTFAKPFMPK